MGARESLNVRKNKARRKVKNGEKSSSGRSLLFFCAIFSRLFRLSSPPLSAPGSPRMDLSMPEDPGGLSSIWHSAMKYLPLFSALLGLLAVVLAVVSVASGIVALDRHFGGICDLGGCTSKTYTTDFVTCNPTF